MISKKEALLSLLPLLLLMSGILFYARWAGEQAAPGAELTHNILK